MKKFKILFFIKKGTPVEALRNNISIEFWKKGINCEIIFRINDELSFKEFSNFIDLGLIFFQFSKDKAAEMINSIMLIKSHDPNMQVNVLFEESFSESSVIFKLTEMGCRDFYYLEDLLSKSIDLTFPSRKKEEIYQYLKLDAPAFHKEKEEIINPEAMKSFFESELDYDALLYEDFKYIYDGIGRKEKLHFLKKIKEQRVLREAKRISPFNGSGVISVWDNSEFACEFSHVASKYLNRKVLLIDLDRMNPSLDLFISKVNSKRTDSYFTDMNLFNLQEMFFKNEEFEDFVFKNFSKPRGNKNLHIIYGENNIGRFEYFSNDMIIKFLDIVARKYDIVIINFNSFIYDAYTCIGIIKSDICIIPTKIDIEKIRKYNRFIDFLSEKQGIDPQKFFYVFFEYDSRYFKNIEFYKSLLKEKFLGQISFSKERLNCRNYKKNYISVFKSSNKMEYLNLFKKLNLIKGE